MPAPAGQRHAATPMTEQAKDEKPFLSRWSERKQTARAGEAAPSKAPNADEHDPPTAIEKQGEIEANRAAAEAIDLDALTDKSDYTPFFRPGVPTALKNAALQRLWRSNPVFAVLDGLDDHFLDFRWPEKGSEVVKTAWKIGRGFLTVEEQAPSEERAAGAPAADPAAARAVPPADETSEKAEEGTTPSPPAPGPTHVVQSTDDNAPASEAAEPVKVGLAGRLDLAAFTRRVGED